MSKCNNLNADWKYLCNVLTPPLPVDTLEHKGGGAGHCL